jgi:hypothetical protein
MPETLAYEEPKATLSRTGTPMRVHIPTPEQTPGRVGEMAPIRTHSLSSPMRHSKLSPVSPYADVSQSYSPKHIYNESLNNFQDSVSDPNQFPLKVPRQLIPIQYDGSDDSDNEGFQGFLVHQLRNNKD